MNLRSDPQKIGSAEHPSDAVPGPCRKSCSGLSGVQILVFVLAPPKIGFAEHALAGVPTPDV